jgi:hypothetical protein
VSSLLPRLGLGSVFCLLACGGSTASQSGPSSPPVPAPAADTASGPPADPPPPSASLPTVCADKAADVCTPPSSFVERLCTKPHQEVALALFANSTPFSRLYLKGKLDELVYDEEVLALRYHPVPKNGIQVGSSSGSYDVLRWDGSCSMAVDAEMLTKNKPPQPRTAHLQWHRLSDRSQTALVASSETVKRAHSKRGKECKGAMSGDVSAGCEKADTALVQAIVEFVRGGGSLPAPDPL